MNVGERLTAKGARSGAPRKGPVWAGPEKDGITYSLLSRFLVCRERFRLLVVEGLRPADQFNHRIEFGNLWHVCEEKYAKAEPGYNQWDDCVKEYAALLCHKYPLQQAEVQNCYEVVRTMFPLYVGHWAKHPEGERTPLLAEQVFDVPYRLPSGRTVRLRGKWDSVDLVKTGGVAAVWLQENKTKSEIDEAAIKRQLTFDLQTMLYLTAMGVRGWPGSIAGVRYSVIKRPRQYQGKKESREEFLARLRGIIAGSPDEFFARWSVRVGPEDVARFRRECLDPILEQLCDWWGWIVLTEGKPFVPTHKGRSLHWRHPFGVYNVLDEGGSSDLDAYLETGSETGLERTENLFRELG